MISRRPAKTPLTMLFNLLERRFGLHLSGDRRHLRDVCEHYLGKRNVLLKQYGEAGALGREEYAKAVLISETARLMLREIDPWPRRKKHKGKSNDR